MGELDAEENGPQWADATTHAPVLGRTFQTLHAGSCQTATTPAPPCWGELTRRQIHDIFFVATTHAPVWGGELADNPSCKMKVSATTHAPMLGANLLQRYDGYLYQGYNSRPPWVGEPSR